MVVTTDMTIYTVAELKPQLLAAINGSDEPRIELSQVAEIDSAGVQLLYLARREAAVAGRKLRISGCTPTVQEILTLVGFPLDEEAAA